MVFHFRPPIHNMLILNWSIFGFEKVPAKFRGSGVEILGRATEPGRMLIQGRKSATRGRESR